MFKFKPQIKIRRNVGRFYSSCNHINIKTAESRLSIKPDKKGFLWRLAQFIKNLELTIEESRNFLDFLDRKIGELYSNNK